MNTNTVTLDLGRYEQLRDLEANINSGKRLVLEINRTFERTEMVFFTDNEIHSKLSLEAVKLKELNETMSEMVNDLKKQLGEKTKTLNNYLEADFILEHNSSTLSFELRVMSIWEFLRWRKNANNQ